MSSTRSVDLTATIAYIERKSELLQQARADNEAWLARHFERGCDEECLPCDRCGHCDSVHSMGLGLYGYHGCQEGACDCDRWLSATDCRGCDGSGEVTVEKGPVEYEVPCPTCGGSGFAA